MRIQNMIAGALLGAAVALGATQASAGIQKYNFEVVGTWGFLENWKEFEKLDGVQKINTLSMISPITNEEKQKLLESLTIKDKIVTLEKIIDFYIYEVGFNNQTVQ